MLCMVQNVNEKLIVWKCLKHAAVGSAHTFRIQHTHQKQNCQQSIHFEQHTINWPSVIFLYVSSFLPYNFGTKAVTFHFTLLNGISFVWFFCCCWFFPFFWSIEIFFGLSVGDFFLFFFYLFDSRSFSIAFESMYKSISWNFVPLFFIPIEPFGSFLRHWIWHCGCNGIAIPI